MFGRKDTKVEIRIPRLSGSADGPRFSANLVAAAAVKADRLLSPEGEGSDVERLNSAGAGNWTDADPVTMIAVKRALAWHRASGGIFEPAIGPVKALWDGVAADPGTPPDDLELAGALELSRSSWLGIDAAGSRLSWKREGCRLELGGIAEGVAVDIALEILASRGVEHASVRLGGTVACLGMNTKTFPPVPWDMGILDPLGKTLLPAGIPGSPDGDNGWRAAAFCGYRSESERGRRAAGGNGHGHSHGQDRGNGHARHAHGQGQGNGHAHHSLGQEQGNGHAHHARGHDHHHHHATGVDDIHGGAGEPKRCRCCGSCGRRFRLIDPVSGRPLPSGLAAAVYHPSSAADASAAAVVMSVLGPAGSERFLSEKGRECFPDGVHAFVFTPGPESSLATASLFLDDRGRLFVTRTITPPQDRPAERERPGSVQLLPLAALAT
ncbi:MAG: FAD:protein FMN transferase [Deltaproteobacteria bacterium]|jgi:thiamine biosynthesis lipoprotein ApbE|nr:FAD:protein FMN transferase [Deltaproteobacteria bacterium]